MLNQVVIFLLLCVNVALVVGTLAGKSKLSDVDEQKIEQMLKRLNKPAVKSIHSPDGDIIDCVWIYHQPAFDHPLLKNHTIQMMAESDSSRDKTGGNKTNVIHQLWRTNGECPENTIPIRRTTRDDLLRSADSLETYGTKSPPNTRDQTEIHEYATVHVNYGQYHGSKSLINVWRPNVVRAEEFSLAQTWVANGDWNTGLNVLEAGWQIYPGLYGGDRNPRFFIYWTNNSYGENSGCYNLRCPGFVQLGGHIALGGALNVPISIYNADQYDFELAIEKDQRIGVWWLWFGGYLVGYWPSSIIPKLARSARRIQWGGEIMYKARSGEPHTLTQMGSGHFAEERFTRAAYFRRIEYIDTSNRPITPFPPNLVRSVTRPGCYNLSVDFDPMVGTYFFYGGPGRNPRCP